MNKKIYTILISSVLLTACATTGQGQRQKIASEATKNFVDEFEKSSPSDQQQWKQMVDMEARNFSQLPGLIENWVQASNKKEPCKVFVLERGDGAPRLADNPKNKIYWDGGCQEGYAVGIGREFQVADGETSSWLAEYIEPKSVPKYYLITNYDRQTIEFKAGASTYLTSLAYVVSESPTGKQITANYSFLNLPENRIYRQVSTIGGDQTTRFMVLPNKNHYFVTRNTNPGNAFIYYAAADKIAGKTGYSVLINNENGTQRVRHLHEITKTNSQEVILPENYLQHLTDIDRRINNNMEMADKVIQEAFVVLNKYKRRVCKGDVTVNFIDNEIYGRICLEHGELGPYNKLIANLQEKQKTRHAEAREELSRKAEMLARQQRIEANERRQNAAALNQSINEFASSMERFNQNSALFTQSFMNSLKTPNAQFGNSEGSRTNCVQVSNVVNCRTY